MEQWEQYYRKWWMANNEVGIKNSLDKHSQMTEYELTSRLRDNSQQMYQEYFMRDFLKELYQQQESEKGVLQFDTKQVEQEADKLIDTIQSAIEKSG